MSKNGEWCDIFYLCTLNTFWIDTIPLPTRNIKYNSRNAPSIRNHHHHPSGFLPGTQQHCTQSNADDALFLFLLFNKTSSEHNGFPISRRHAAGLGGVVHGWVIDSPRYIKYIVDSISDCFMWCDGDLRATSCFDHFFFLLHWVKRFSLQENYRWHWFISVL